jgi:transcriptional regulator with XRE-family HTH domain
MNKKKGFSSLAEAIQSWISKENLKMESAAKALGISLAELHNILRGKTIPKRKTLFRIAKVIKISNPHGYILSEVNRVDTPDRIKELLWFFYEKTIDAPDIDVAEVVNELHPALEMSPQELDKEERLLKKTLTMLIRLKWTTEYWNIAQETIRTLLALQDEHILQWSVLGREEYLGIPCDLGEVFRRMDQDAKKGVKMFHLDRKESPRGYVMTAVSIPAGYGAFEFGTATTYGFEMGMVIGGEGMFFSKGIRKDEEFVQQRFKEMMTLCFSRHRSHCVFVTGDKMEMLNIQIPYAARHFAKLPTSFRMAKGKSRIVTVPTMLYTEGKDGGSLRMREFRTKTVRLPDDLEKLIVTTGEKDQR